MAARSLVATEDNAEAEAPRRDVQWLIGNIDKPNLCDDLDSDVLARIGAKVVEEFQVDEESRIKAGWTARYDSALKLAMLVKSAKNFPWPNASNVKYPLIAEAAIQFNARAYPAIVDGNRVAKCQVLGKPDQAKQDRADRVSAHMSYQLLTEMEEWEADTDQLLLILPVVGTLFRKSYFDPMLGRNCSEMVMADKLVANYWSKPLNVCPRVTQVCSYYPHEITERVRSGVWRKLELGQPQDAANDDEAPHTFLEQHRLWDLDEDGYPEPYIVTVHKDTMQVVRIYARYDEDGIKANEQGEVVGIAPVRYFTKYSFIPSLDGSFYDIGFGTLLEPLSETINSTINQLMDAGTLANAGGGLINSGVSIKSGTLRISMGEYKKVDVQGGTLRDNIMATPTTPPSSVLFQLLGSLIEAAKDITATKDILTGETGQSNMPVGTTLAMIEQGLKVFTAIYKRVHRSVKQELACLFRLNRLYLEQEAYFTFQDSPGSVAREDYNQNDLDVIPVSDPTVVTDMQRIGRAQFLLQFRPDPLMNGMEINKRVLEAASIPDVKALFAPPQPPQPDPKVVEAMAKLDHDKERIGLERERLDLDRRQMAIAEADAKAANALKYAQALQTVAGIGKGSTKNADGTTTATDTPLSGGDIALLADVHQMAVSELEQVEQEFIPDAGNAPAEVQPGDVPGMAGPPVDPALPPIPAGPADGVGEALDGGPADVGPPADQGVIDGGAVGPEVA